MVYEFKGKKIRIPDEEIKKNMKILDLTEDEAIQMYLEDEGYLENEEVEELSKKAKENKTDKIVATDKTKTRAKSTREPKENPVKEGIIAGITKFLATNPSIVDIKIENKAKLISFRVENREFKLDLVEKRQKKA